MRARADRAAPRAGPPSARRSRRTVRLGHRRRRPPSAPSRSTVNRSATRLHLFEEVRDVDDRLALLAQPGAPAANSASASAWARLLVGSSSTSTRQPTATARAISTICCAAIGSRPPARRGGCADGAAPPARAAPLPHRASIDDAQRADEPAAAARLHAEQDVLGHRQVRRQRQLLVDHRHARRAARPAARPARSGAPSSSISPASGWIAPDSTFISVLLPAPFSPTSACTSPACDRQVDAAQRQRGAEALAHAAHFRAAARRRRARPFTP